MCTQKCENQISIFDVLPKSKPSVVRIAVVGTGSDGNAYLVTVGDSKILLDAGLPTAKIRKFNGNKIADIDAFFVTHSHTDHALALEELMNMGVRLIYTPETVNCGKFISYGDWQDHDVPCRGYAIDFSSDGVMLHYITDTKQIVVSDEYLQAERKHYWIVECDYCEETMLYNDEHESANVVMRNNRTRETHLSDCDVIEFFKQDKARADAVLFVHSSKLNFDLKLFKSEWGKAMPKMLVAESGAVYEMRGKKIEKVIV